METEIIQGLKNGDEESFRKLVDSFQQEVLNICYSFTHDRNDAEDVAQDVFIEIFQSIHNFRGEAKLKTWINRIAINRCLDLLRKKKRKKRMAQLVDLFGGSEPVREPAAPVSSRPDYNYEQQERAKVLYSAVHALAENQRIAITLSKYQGYDNSEIAEIMGVTLSAVASLLHRARKNLYRHLYRYYKKNL